MGSNKLKEDVPGSSPRLLGIEQMMMFRQFAQTFPDVYVRRYVVGMESVLRRVCDQDIMWRVSECAYDNSLE